MIKFLISAVLIVAIYSIVSTHADGGYYGRYGLAREKWQNGHFNYDPNTGTYGTPHEKHNALFGYGGYGNVIPDDYYGYSYGVLGRGAAKGYNRWNPISLLKKINRRTPAGTV